MPRNHRRVKEMSRYNSNYGSHDQLQDLRKLNIEVMRERDLLLICVQALEKTKQELEDELYLAHEALRREMP
jgi:hypothetical protein